MALLLPPFYALSAPAVLGLLIFVRVCQGAVYRRGVNSPAPGLAGARAADLFPWVGPPLRGLPAGGGGVVPRGRGAAGGGALGVAHATYAGAPPAPIRSAIRKAGQVVVTNPDMLHIGVLPRHDLWGDVLHNLRYVVVDEAHVYRGVFGSHVANVLRRLRRLARIYGAEPQFLLASATIANIALSGGGQVAVAGVSMATTYAEQISKVEAFRPQKRFADALKGLHLYGCKVVRPELLVVASVKVA